MQYPLKHTNFSFKIFEQIKSFNRHPFPLIRMPFLRYLLFFPSSSFVIVFQFFIFHTTKRQTFSTSSDRIRVVQQSVANRRQCVVKTVKTITQKRRICWVEIHTLLYQIKKYFISSWNLTFFLSTELLCVPLIFYGGPI